MRGFPLLSSSYPSSLISHHPVFKNKKDGWKTFHHIDHRAKGRLEEHLFRPVASRDSILSLTSFPPSEHGSLLSILLSFQLLSLSYGSVYIPFKHKVLLPPLQISESHF